jgi:hypothetical protein
VGEPVVTDTAALAATIVANNLQAEGRLASEHIADAVATRLSHLGAVTELHQLGGLSAQELDLLVERERR